MFGKSDKRFHSLLDNLITFGRFGVSQVRLQRQNCLLKFEIYSKISIIGPCSKTNRGPFPSLDTKNANIQGN